MGTRRSEPGTDFLIFPASKGEDERPLRVFSRGRSGRGRGLAGLTLFSLKPERARRSGPEIHLSSRRSG